MSSRLPVAVLAGGMATRLGDAAGGRPKALVEVAGRPFALHQLRLLARNGVRDVVMCVGHLAEQIEAEIGDGSAAGLAVRYSHDPPGLAGTAGALREALPLLGDAFLVLYGDTYLRIDYAGVERSFLESGLPGLLTVLRNEGRWDTSNTLVENGRVVAHDKREPTPAMEWIDYGLGALQARALDADPEASDLSDVYAALARRGELGAYEATNRFFEIGTPEALAEADRFLASAADE
jgi:N-acetyl-alpha-D-muramate 1-phosphate uridylyltransferase